CTALALALRAGAGPQTFGTDEVLAHLQAKHDSVRSASGAHFVRWNLDGSFTTNVPKGKPVTHHKSTTLAAFLAKHAPRRRWQYVAPSAADAADAAKLAAREQTPASTPDAASAAQSAPDATPAPAAAPASTKRGKQQRAAQTPATPAQGHPASAQQSERDAK